MPLTNLARDMLADWAIGGGTYDLIDGTTGHIGVGNGTTLFDASHTDLQGASKLRKPLDAGYPQRSNNVLTLRATFGTSEANFAWEERGIFNALSGGEMFSRRVVALGTKDSSESWQITLTDTFVLA